MFMCLRAEMAALACVRSPLLICSANAMHRASIVVIVCVSRLVGHANLSAAHDAGDAGIR